jgi:C4-dicarboxylate transporter DctM subunit
MTPLTVGVIGIFLLFFFMAFRMPVGLAMGLAGFIWFCYLRGWSQGLHMLGTLPYGTASLYTMSVIPLFVLMGNFCFYGDVTKDIYSATHKWLGHLPGGLAMATTVGCAAFAAVSGSSVACAVTMGSIALPEMRRYNYDPKLATGTVAAGGTLGILIPPSMGFIFYSLLTTQSISELFMAGIIPGILLTLLFISAIYIITLRNPSLGPRARSASLVEKMRSIRGVWAVLILFLVVLGGMYLGVVTPTEAAGVGAFTAFLIMVIKRRLTYHNFINSFLETGKTVAMAFIILLGAQIFSQFIALTRIPYELGTFISAIHAPRLIILICILAVYLILGCLMDPISMIILTIPIFYPVIVSLGYDPVWFGVIIVLTMEMGLITPPVGVNVFSVSGVAKEVPMETIFRGITPFLIAMVVCLALLIAFPKIALFLPQTMS